MRAARSAAGVSRLVTYTLASSLALIRTLKAVPLPLPLPYPYPKQECLAAFRESVRQDRGRAGAKDAPLPLRGSTADEPALRNGGPH